MLELLDGTHNARLVITDIELHRLLTFYMPRIRHLDAHRPVRDAGFAVTERRVAQSITEGELRARLEEVKPAVAQQNVLAIYLAFVAPATITPLRGERHSLPILHGHTEQVRRTERLALLACERLRQVSRTHAGITHSSHPVSRVVGEILRYGVGELATGTHVAAQDVGQGMARLTAQVPRLQQTRSLVQPGHGVRVATHHDKERAGVGLQERADEFVLAERQVVGKAVATLAVLLVVLVQSAHEDYHVSLTCHPHRLSTERVVERLREFLRPSVHARARSIALGILHLSHLAVTLLQSTQRAHLVEGFQLAAASTGTQAAGGVLSHYEQGCSLAFSGLFPGDAPDMQFRQSLLRERQQSALVLEQHDALLRNLPCRLAVFRRVHGTVGLHPLVGETSGLGVLHRAQDEAQHAACLVIDDLLGHLTPAAHVQVAFAQEIALVADPRLARESVRSRTHLQVQSVEGTLVRVVSCPPVRDDRSVKGPFPFQDVVDEPLVVRGVLVEVLVVRPHNAPRLALAHRSLEGTQVEFVECAVRHPHIDMSPELLLLVQRIMLHATGHAVALQPLDVGDAEAGSQQRILAHVLKVTSVERRAVQVDPRSQQHRLAAVASLLAHHLAIKFRQRGVPRGRQTRQGRECRTGIVGPLGMVPVVPVDFHAHAMRSVAHVQFRNAESLHAGAGKLTLCVAEPHLLLQRHLPERLLHHLLQFPVGLCRDGEREQEGSQDSQFLFHVYCFLRWVL